LFGLAYELLHEGRLADAGLTTDEDETPVPVDGRHELHAKCCHLFLATDENLFRDGARLAHPHDFPESPRLREPFEFVLAGIAERDVRDRAGELPCHVRDEDLSAVSFSADTRCGVHCFTRELSVLEGDLSGIQADAYTERRPTPRSVERVERTLDADRARDCTARRDEDREE